MLKTLTLILLVTSSLTGIVRAGFIENEPYNEEFDRRRAAAITEELGLSNSQALSAIRIAMSYVWIVACKGKEPSGKQLDAIQSGALAKMEQTKFNIAILAIVGSMVMDTTDIKVQPGACQLARRLSQ